MVVAAVDAAAAALGLFPGMPLAQAQALVPGLAPQPAEPEADAAALRRLASWCLRYTPLTAPDAPDGIWLDITGCAHLHGGEAKLLRDLVGRLAAQGITASTAVADTPGAAHAMARCRGRKESEESLASPLLSIIPVGESASALAPLPITALRLPPDIADALRLLGFETIGQLAATPRAPLTRRFGPVIAQRLDQALGTVFEPIVPVFPPDLVQARQSFVEPLSTPEAFTTVIASLTATICTALENTAQGARRLDLVFERVDGSIQSLRIGTARPARDARHLARLLEEKLERVDPGLGVEAMQLVVPRAEPLAYTQTASLTEHIQTPDIAPLVDRLENRLGSQHVWRAAPMESDVPERSVRRLPALAPRETRPLRPTGAGPLRSTGVGSLRPTGAGSLRSSTGVGSLRSTDAGSLRPNGAGLLHSGAAPTGPQRSATRASYYPASTWPADLPRPVRLLDPPQPVDAMALLPDQPPVAFTWRHVRHRVRRADGPERIAGEWWKRTGETRSVRDYFRVEDEDGHRYWLFRRGDGEDPATGDLRWFLHGFF